MSFELPTPNSIQEIAIQMHEFYLSLIGEGFTPHQALHILLNLPCCEREE